MSENLITNDYLETLGAIDSDPDIRDYRIAAATVQEAKETFPNEFELNMPAVKNQGSISSCVAHSLSTVIEYYNIKQHNEDAEMSVGYIYGNRDVIGYQGEGMITRTAIANVCAEGDVPNTLFPFNEEVPGIIEKVRAEKNNLEESAAPFKFTSYFRVKTADEIKTALMKGCPVVFAITWYKGMKVVNGILTSSTDEKTGSHCMVIYGWDERGWKFQNSWGILWGNGGRAILPYDFKINEAYCVIDEYVGDIDIKKPFKATTEFGKWLVRSLNKIYCFFYRIWYNSKH